MKEKLDQIKEFIGGLQKKTKVGIGVGGVIVVAAAIILALVLNHTTYAGLYSGVNEDEATQITAKLQEQGVDYKYDGQGNIQVPEKQVDQIKAQLASEGYPKSGFTYDVFTSNATMMTTDSDKQTYKIYELQNRIGATISLFDGVKDTKVTIALGETQKYALDDTNQKEASASVVMIMKDNGSPTKEQATAVQNLVSKSIPGMTIENVAVFDGNGNDVSVQTADGNAVSTKASEEISKVVEDQIAQKVLNILEPIYGTNNVRVSPKAKINMETLIRETVGYTTPEKKDADDKTGILSKESGATEESTDASGAGGTAGTETNADVTENVAQDGTTTSGYKNETFDREYLVDQIKEQGQVPAGAIDDLTMSVVINGSSFGDLTEESLRSLIGNSAGITAENQANKISVVSTPFYKMKVEDNTAKEASAGVSNNQIYLLIGIVVGVLLLGGIILFIVLKRKKRNVPAEEDRFIGDTDEILDSLQNEKANKELIDLQNEKGMELRNSVREFTDQSPEIAAQMLRNWLKGEDSDASKP